MRYSCRSPQHAGRQGGQALTEFLVLAMALIPLFLLVPMIAKYQDIAHATQLASRYVAFDATNRGGLAGDNGWAPPAQLADEVRRRFYGNSDAPIKSDDVAGDFDAHRNLFWRDPYGNPLIKKFSDVTLSFGTSAATQSAGFGPGSDGTVFNQSPFANANHIGLASPGIYKANVSVALANLPAGIRNIEPFDRINLKIQRHTSLLFDPWSANTTVRTEHRVATLAPLNSMFGLIRPMIAGAIGFVDLSEVKAPAIGDLSQWRDAVPADRLKPERY
ncbi:MAG: hypothetical protein H7327_04350 [Herminiimonas sp.]|nr:hypothetical protein [Herminiimonas sp.]